MSAEPALWHLCAACGTDRFPIIDLAHSIILPATPVVLWLRCPACNYGWPDPAMSSTDYHGMNRAELLQRLDVINEAFDRMSVDRFLTRTECEAVPLDNLAGMVAAAADHLTVVMRKLSGIV